MNDSDNDSFIEQLSRTGKLFYLQGLTQIPTERSCQQLLQLVDDSDPVVRGKVALALEDCPTDTIRRGADRLLGDGRPERTILGLELLGSLEGIDFSEELRELFDHEDKRVRSTMIDTVPSLPRSTALELLKELIGEAYKPDLDDALENCFRRLNDPDSLPLLKQWYRKAPEEHRGKILRIASALPTSDGATWVENELEQPYFSEETRRVIQQLDQLNEPNTTNSKQ